MQQQLQQVEQLGEARVEEVLVEVVLQVLHNLLL